MKAVARKPGVNEVQTKRTCNPAASLKRDTIFNSGVAPGYPVVQRAPLCPCDGGCPRCTSAVQAKLSVSQPQDRYEQEADRVADQVMRLPEPDIRRKPT